MLVQCSVKGFLCRYAGRFGLEKISRREFGNLTILSLLSSIFPFLASCQKRKFTLPERSNIIKIYNDAAVKHSGGKDNVDLNEQVIEQMLTAGVKKLTGANSTKEAWRSIIPDVTKKIAIKINCQTTAIFTKAKVVNAIISCLVDRGVPPDNIVIYDLRDNAFTYAGFLKNLQSGIKVGTNEELGGYSLLSWVGNPLKTNRVRFCKVLAGEGEYGCDYLINVPVLKALDGWSGVSLSMKNHFGSISNPAALHSSIHDRIAQLNAHSLIQKKTRLIVVDGIFAQYKWSNSRDQSHVAKTKLLLLGYDSVAVDYTGWQILESLRKGYGMKPLDPKPMFLEKATNNFGLGNSDPGKIKVQTI